MLSVLASLVIFCPASSSPSVPEPSRVRAIVHPGMELLATYLWMSEKFSQPPDSRYKLDVWNHFSKFKAHESTTVAKGVKTLYPDFTETGWWLKDRAFKTPASSVWYKVFDQATVRSLHEAAERFARASDFWSFYDRHKGDYDRWCREFEALVIKDQTLDKLDAFYRYADAQEKPQVTICLEPLNGWGAHAILFREMMGEDDGDRVTFMLGPNGSSLDTHPRFNNSSYIVPTVWHEGTHVYIEHLFKRYAEEIETLSRLFNKEKLASQNISTWRYCLNENVVRAVVAVLIRQHQGEQAYMREVVQQSKQIGFIYTYQIAEEIWEQFVKKPESYADFDAYFPVILKSLSKLKGPEDAKLPG